MFNAGDTVRVVAEGHKHFGKVGIVSAIRADGYMVVRFGGRGRPSFFTADQLALN